MMLVNAYVMLQKYIDINIIIFNQRLVSEVKIIKNRSMKNCSSLRASNYQTLILFQKEIIQHKVTRSLELVHLQDLCEGCHPEWDKKIKIKGSFSHKVEGIYNTYCNLPTLTAIAKGTILTSVSYSKTL